MDRRLSVIIRSVLIPAVLIVITATFVVSQARPMTNADVIRMTQAKVSAKVIKDAIDHAEADFDTSPDGLIALSNAKVKDDVISLIQRKQAGRASSSTAPVTAEPLTPNIRIPSTQRADWTYKGNYFMVTLNKCMFARKSVICDFSVLNKDKEDRVFGITGFSFGVPISKLYDNMGNTVGCSSAEVANTGKRDIASSLVVSRKTVPAVLHCQGVDAKALSIAKLAVEMCAAGDCRTVEYREIPIEGDDQHEY